MAGIEAPSIFIFFPNSAPSAPPAPLLGWARAEERYIKVPGRTGESQEYHLPLRFN